MNKHRYSLPMLLKLATAALLLAAPSLAQAQGNPDRITVPLTDPARPALVKASLLYGGIIVKGGDQKEVLVEARGRGEESDRERERGSRQGSLRRLNVPSTSLSIEEENNEVRVSAGMRTVDLVITVPRRTSLYLRATNDGDIVVDGVEGEIDVNNLNGEVTMTNVGGSAVVHALNGDIKVTFQRIAGDKPMAFSSLNGDIDVTFPATLKANLVLSAGQGEVYTDFDVQLQPGSNQPIVEDSRGKGGKYKVKMDKMVHYSVGGGGPEIRFTNFNGDIYIRKTGAQ